MGTMLSARKEWLPAIVTVNACFTENCPVKFIVTVHSYQLVIFPFSSEYHRSAVNKLKVLMVLIPRVSSTPFNFGTTVYLGPLVL